jgi:hypothetical protein
MSSSRLRHGECHSLLDGLVLVPKKEAGLRTNMSLHVSCEVPCLGIRLVPHVRTMHEAVALGTSRRAVRLLQIQVARHQIVTKE